jgi:hypothetical protein
MTSATLASRRMALRLIEVFPVMKTGSSPSSTTGQERRGTDRGELGGASRVGQAGSPFGRAHHSRVDRSSVPGLYEQYDKIRRACSSVADLGDGLEAKTPPTRVQPDRDRP